LINTSFFIGPKGDACDKILRLLLPTIMLDPSGLKVGYHLEKFFFTGCLDHQNDL
jgi:hypothetical protein